jgi:hypothetical protein
LLAPPVVPGVAEPRAPDTSNFVIRSVGSFERGDLLRDVYFGAARARPALFRPLVITAAPPSAQGPWRRAHQAQAQFWGQKPRSLGMPRRGEPPRPLSCARSQAPPG